jgi:hypothetical protein
VADPPTFDPELYKQRTPSSEGSAGSSSGVALLPDTTSTPAPTSAESYSQPPSSSPDVDALILTELPRRHRERAVRHILFVPFIDGPAGLMPEGELLENMVVSVEGYAGEVGGQDGVKLEDTVWITSSRPPVISQYPFDDSFLR